MFRKAMFRFLLSVVVSVILLAAFGVYGQDNQGRPDLAADKHTDSETENKELTPAQKLDDFIERVKREKKIQPDRLDEAVNIISRAGEVLPAAELLNKLDKLQQYRQDSVIPAAQKQLTRDVRPDYLILSLQVRKMRDVTAEQIKAHPASKAFPGSVPEDAKRVRRNIKINTSTDY